MIFHSPEQTAAEEEKKAEEADLQSLREAGLDRLRTEHEQKVKVLEEQLTAIQAALRLVAALVHFSSNRPRKSLFSLQESWDSEGAVTEEGKEIPSNIQYIEEHPHPQ